MRGERQMNVRRDTGFLFWRSELCSSILKRLFGSVQPKKAHCSVLLCGAEGFPMDWKQFVYNPNSEVKSLLCCWLNAHICGNRARGVVGILDLMYLYVNTADAPQATFIIEKKVSTGNGRNEKWCNIKCCAKYLCILITHRYWDLLDLL